MIILEKCDIVLSRMAPMQTGVVQVEGKALVLGAIESGLQTVKPSTGGAGEKFVGVMYGEQGGFDATASYPYSSTFVVAAGGNVTLPYAPVTGQLFVANAAGTELTEGADAAGTFQIAGTALHVNSTLVGTTITVRMNYMPSAGEVMSRQGSGYPGGSSSNANGLTGVCEHGTMFTDQYDVTADWSAPTVIRLGAGGKFTTEGSGAIIASASCRKIPTAGDPWLSIRFTA